MFLLTLLLIHCRGAHVSFSNAQAVFAINSWPSWSGTRWYVSWSCHLHDKWQACTCRSIKGHDFNVFAVAYIHFNNHYFISVMSSQHFPGPICLGVGKRGRKQADNCYSGKTWRKRCLPISHHEKERNRQEGSPEHIFKSQQAFAKVCSYLIFPYLFRSSIPAGKTQHCVF